MLLYDFDLHVGQTLTYPHQRYLTSIDSILLSDGSYRRRFVFSSNDYWIEGIGSVFGLFGSFKLFANSDLSQCKIWLNCYSQNDQTLFIDTPLSTGITCDSINISVFTGLTLVYSSSGILFSSGIIQLTFDENVTQFEIVNSLGQIFLHSGVYDPTPQVDISSIPTGMYFIVVINGKRRVSMTKFVKI
ncbi:MAG: T9SS type A sorting domain-containing protein [Chitinophagales bacterium]